MSIVISCPSHSVLWVLVQCIEEVLGCKFKLLHLQQKHQGSSHHYLCSGAALGKCLKSSLYAYKIKAPTSSARLSGANR